MHLQHKQYVQNIFKIWHTQKMLSKDLKGRILILTCYQATSALSDSSLRRGVMLLHDQVTEDQNALDNRWSLLLSEVS